MEVTRFGEMRDGDSVTITYYQSTFYELKHPHAPAPVVSEEVGAVESGSRFPGATFSRPTTERITVTAGLPNTQALTADPAATPRVKPPLYHTPHLHRE